jgi:RES domain-containing protein
MTLRTAYRHAAHDSPWWANPSARPGRFHRAFEHPTQYLALHPLGPAAEVLRNHVGPAGRHDLGTLLLNLWAVLVDAGDVLDITWDRCDDFGITPEQLVADDHQATQDLADRLRAEGAAGVCVPSAALPGTQNLVLFGPRVAHPYLMAPVTPEEVQTGHLTDGARPPAELVDLVRWIGTPHDGLAQWRATGVAPVLDDPIGRRW